MDEATDVGTAAKVRLFRESDEYTPVIVVVWGTPKKGRFEYEWCRHLSSPNVETAIANAKSLALRLGVMAAV